MAQEARRDEGDLGNTDGRGQVRFLDELQVYDRDHILNIVVS